MSLKPYYFDDETIEIGIDEVGRGPMFGRVYAACVILPKDNSFKHELMKDSKKFTSKTKLEATANYIKENCIRYSVGYENEDHNDNNNIKISTHSAMHKAIKNIIKLNEDNLILVDGNDFKPYIYIDNESEMIKEIPSQCIIGGDNIQSSIAAASILAKVERDNYIYELCKEFPKLDEYYDLSKNKGYSKTIT
jgi:ribonuclease HII